MKLFTARFFGGTTMVAVGLFCLVIGTLSLLPPTNSVALGIILLVIGILVTPVGYKFAKDAPPAGHKTAIETLRKANLLDKTSKK
jgi:membrane protein implicated in regulation of membrane protease activity